MENRIPIERLSLGCHLAAGAGSFTSFHSFQDTVEAAATAESVNAHELVSEVQGDAASIIDELNTIDEVRDQMTLEEEEEIYGNARTVQGSVKNCTALDVSIEAGKAFERNLNTAEMAGVSGKEAASRPHPSQAKAFSLAALLVEELCSQKRRQSMSIITHGGLVKTAEPTAHRMPLVITMCPKSSKCKRRGMIFSETMSFPTGNPQRHLPIAFES
ncbi:hypothetical protein FGB62_267g016 [Gracilaria domingensis]|nr:hypothetical protein FGB62_267g016 [Gracilaria domingensis]